MKYIVTVKPNSKKGPLVEEEGTNHFKIYLREKPHDGEANTALIALLSKHFKVPKTSIKIVAGQKSHQKIVEF